MYLTKVTMDGRLIRDLLIAAIVLLASHQIRKTESRTVGCGGKPADVVFLLDGSYSIWRPHFRRQLQFVKDMIDWFSVGRDDMRVAVITYADYPRLQFQLHEYFTKPQLHVAIDAVRQNGGYHTRTGQALRYARENVLRGRGVEVRTNVTKVVVVVTDGLSDNRTATALEAEQTKAAGIHVFAVGVGKKVDLEELDAISSRPSNYYTFLVDGYEGLDNIREVLAIKTCTVTDPTTTAAPTTTTTTTTTPTSTTAANIVSTYARNDDDSGSTSNGKKQPGAKDNPDDNDDDDDDDDDDDTKGSDGDDSDKSKNETFRTPIILQPPTFIPNLPENSDLEEFKLPEGENNLIDSSNCSQIQTDQRNETGDRSKENRETDKTPLGTQIPCLSNGGGKHGHPENVRPESEKIDGEKDPNLSGNYPSGTNRNGHFEYNEHGYWIGTRFVRTGNRTSGGSDSDTQALIGREELTHPNVTTSMDDNREGDNGKADKIKGDPDGNDPRYHVYLSSGPWGVGGYWFLDEELGYVWYRYVRPGEFELDMETTNEIRELENGQRKPEVDETGGREGTEETGGRQGTEETGGRQGTDETGGRQGIENGDDLRATHEPPHLQSTVTSRPEVDADTRTSPRKSDGYWGRDEHGHFVWYRRIGAGVFQKLYPMSVPQTKSTAKSSGDLETSTLKVESGAEQSPAGPEDSYSGSTLSTPQYNRKFEGGDVDESDGIPQSPDDVENEFWRFVRGRRVWIQYVPPNDLDEEDGTVDLRDPMQAVEIPLDVAAIDTTRDRAQSQGHWKVDAERRRVWHSSKSLRDSSVSSEELAIGPVGADDSAAIRLDDDRGRHLWTQLVNFTNTKFSGDSLSGLRDRFETMKDELNSGRSGRNQSDRFHESYWFYDDTGKRFQVIHRYNKSAGGKINSFHHPSEDPSLSGKLFLPGQVNADIKWEHEEAEVHGPAPSLGDSDGAREYEHYGGEYLIRALGPTKHNHETRESADTQALRSRKDTSIDFPDRNSIQPGNNANYLRTRETNKKGVEPQNRSALMRDDNALPRTNSQRSSRIESAKRRGRKSNKKGCRSKKPIELIFAINLDENTRNEDHMQFMLTITQYTAAHLNESNAAGVQVKYRHEFRDHPDPGNVPKTVNKVTQGKRETLSEIFSGVSRMFFKNAADRKRSGRPRARRVLVILTDGQLEERRTSGRHKRLQKDVEVYVVGVGDGTDVRHLEKIARESKSKHTHVIQDLNPHSNPSNPTIAAEKLISAICRSLAKHR